MRIKGKHHRFMGICIGFQTQLCVAPLDALIGRMVLGAINNWSIECCTRKRLRLANNSISTSMLSVGGTPIQAV